MQDGIDKQLAMLKCRVLGVGLLATESEIKAARKRLAQRYHPDKAANLSSCEQDWHQKKFAKVQEAYDFLKKNNSIIQDKFKHEKNFSLNPKIASTDTVYRTVGNISKGQGK